MVQDFAVEQVQTTVCKVPRGKGRFLYQAQNLTGSICFFAVPEFHDAAL